MKFLSNSLMHFYFSDQDVSQNNRIFVISFLLKILSLKELNNFLYRTNIIFYFRNWMLMLGICIELKNNCIIKVVKIKIKNNGKQVFLW